MKGNKVFNDLFREHIVLSARFFAEIRFSEEKVREQTNYGVMSSQLSQTLISVHAHLAHQRLYHVSCATLFQAAFFGLLTSFLFISLTWICALYLLRRWSHIAEKKFSSVYR